MKNRSGSEGIAKLMTRTAKMILIEDAQKLNAMENIYLWEKSGQNLVF